MLSDCAAILSNCRVCKNFCVSIRLAFLFLYENIWEYVMDKSVLHCQTVTKVFITRPFFCCSSELLFSTKLFARYLNKQTYSIKRYFTNDLGCLHKAFRSLNGKLLPSLKKEIFQPRVRSQDEGKWEIRTFEFSMRTKLSWMDENCVLFRNAAT